MWWIVVALQLSCSYAQLTPPDELVCVGKQVVFVCQQTGSAITWTVDLPGGISNELTQSVSSSQAGTVLTFPKSPTSNGFGFEIHVLSSSSSSSIISELRVTAVRQLNGVTVECTGASGSYTEPTVQIVSVDPPAAPSGVMITADQSQFTPSTASITLTWSASSGADNYTIMVTPLLPSGQSLVSTTTTSLQLTVLYNEEYSINITAHNCAGSNSTIIVPMTVVGCRPLSPLANGSFSKYSSGAVGAMLTFQCDTGYMPQEEVTSTCLSNRSWVPIPECQAIIDCGGPFSASGLFIELSNNTDFDALIMLHCEESNITVTAVCGSNGQWEPNPMSLKCDNGKSKVLVTDDPNLNVTDSSDSDPQLDIYIGISVTTLLVVLITLLIIIIMAVIAVKRRQGANIKSKRSLELDSYEMQDQNDCEYAQTRHPGPRRNNQVGEEYSVLSQTTLFTTHNLKPPPGRGDTLIYADLGPSSGKRRTPVTSNIQDDHRVVYSTVNHALQQVTKKRKHNKTHDKTGPCPADAALDLDMLLIQLKPQVLTKWKQFAEAVGLSNIIKELSQYSADECIVEVFDQWLKSHPTKPTWRNVADVLNGIGLQQLAKDIMEVYQTGELPKVVDMDTVPKMTSDTETPPPLPPKIDSDDLFLPARPPKPVV